MEKFKVGMIEHDNELCQDVYYTVIVEADDMEDAMEIAESESDRSIAIHAKTIVKSIVIAFLLIAGLASCTEEVATPINPTPEPTESWTEEQIVTCEFWFEWENDTTLVYGCKDKTHVETGIHDRLINVLVMGRF